MGLSDGLSDMVDALIRQAGAGHMARGRIVR